MNQLLAASDCGGEIGTWYMIPMITTLAPPSYKEIARVSKRERTAEFRLRIPHAEFKEATKSAQRTLLVDLLVRSVQMMSSLGVKGLDVDRLVSDLQQV